MSALSITLHHFILLCIALHHFILLYITLYCFTLLYIALYCTLCNRHSIAGAEAGLQYIVIVIIIIDNM